MPSTRGQRPSGRSPRARDTDVAQCEVGIEATPRWRQCGRMVTGAFNSREAVCSIRGRSHQRAALQRNERRAETRPRRKTAQPESTRAIPQAAQKATPARALGAQCVQWRELRRHGEHATVALRKMNNQSESEEERQAAITLSQRPAVRPRFIVKDSLATPSFVGPHDWARAARCTVDLPTLSQYATRALQAESRVSAEASLSDSRR